MAIDERLWRITQKRLGYSDDEMIAFRKDPRNEDVLAKSSALMDKMFVLEVVESHGCIGRHTVGTRFYFDGVGNLLTERCPKKVCAYSLSAALPLLFAATEMIYAGVDPNEMRFKRTSCFDVGLDCGGWGHIVLELRVQDNSSTHPGA